MGVAHASQILAPASGDPRDGRERLFCCIRQPAHQAFRNSSGSLAVSAGIRRVVKFSEIERELVKPPRPHVRITPGLCFRSPDCFCCLVGFSSDVEIKMITAAECRAWAEESLEWARNATKESSRTTYIRWAGVWLESALRVERLTALIEDRSKEPTPTAEYVWQLPPFHDWPRYRIEMRIRKRPSVRPKRFDQLAFDF